MSFNKEDLTKRLPLFISSLSLALSIIAVVGVNKLQKDVIESGFLPVKTEKNIKIIDNIPDVEIIRNDGSIEKMSANESKDVISSIIEQKTNKNKQAKPEKKVITAVARGEQKKNNNGQQKQKIKLNEKAVKVEKNNNKNSNNKAGAKATQAKELFVVQVGSFKDENSAKSLCERTKRLIANSKCIVEKANSNVFRAVARGFANKNDVNNFLQELKSKLGIDGLVRKV